MNKVHDALTPSGWQTATLDAVITELAVGVSVNGEDRAAEADEIAVLRLNAVSNGRFLPNENKVVVAEERSRAATSPRRGDVLMSRASGSIELVGACVYVESDYPTLFLPDLLWRLTTDPNENCSRWLHYALTSPLGRRAIVAKVAGSNGTHKISQTNFRGITVLRPPLREQRKIAAILSTWDRAIELTLKLIAGKQQRKAALMQHLLTGKLRLPGFADEWNRLPLSEVGLFSKGFGFSKTDVIAAGKPAIRYGELYTTHNTVVRHVCSFITDDHAARSKEIRCGDILFPCSGETADEIGRPSVYLDPEAAYAGGDIIILTPKRGDPLFLAYALNAADAIRYRASHAKGQSVVHIYIPDLLDYGCPFPPLSEQQAIAAVLNNADCELDLHQRKLDALRRQKKGLMQQLLTGKVRVNAEPGTTVPG